MSAYWVEFNYGMDATSEDPGSGNVAGTPVQFQGQDARTLPVTFFGPIVPSPYYGTFWMLNSLPYAVALEGGWELASNGYTFVVSGQILFTYTISIGTSYLVGTQPDPTTLVGPTLTASVLDMSGVGPNEPTGELTVAWTAFAWAQISVPTLFTPAAAQIKDQVNFNGLTADQQQAVVDGADIYHGLGGSDVVTLPDKAKYDVSVGNGKTLGWTDNSTFYTGSQAGDTYTVAGGDGNYNIAEADGAEFITINGNGSSTITAGSGADTVTINGNGNNTVNLGSGSTTLRLYGNGLTFIQFTNANQVVDLANTGSAPVRMVINGFVVGDSIDFVNQPNLKLSAAFSADGGLDPGEVDVYSGNTLKAILDFTGTNEGTFVNTLEPHADDGEREQKLSSSRNSRLPCRTLREHPLFGVSFTTEKAVTCLRPTFQFPTQVCPE